MQNCIVLPCVCTTKHVKKHLLLFVVLLMALSASAQNAIEIKGKVTDDKGVPLYGASVILKGSKTGTVTNNSGEYSFSINNAGTLIFSYAGYTNKEVAVTNTQEVNVSLSLNNSSLNDVIVTGYSKQSKRDVTGAVSTINSDVISKTPVSDVGQILQGRVAGVSVDDQGGPGSSAVVRIRGFGTLGDNDPLYVIDGVQMRGSNNLINTNDIETITVLKDPSLTSLYGAEGSNGVIVITTKSGKIGAPKLEYNTYIGTQYPIKYPSMLSPQQYADAYWNYLSNSGLQQTDLFYGSGNKPVLPDYIIETPSGAPTVIHPGDPAPDPSLYDPYSYRILKTNKSGTDWFKEIFQPGFTQSHQLSLSGATDKSNYALSFNYLDDRGVVLKTYFKRYSVRVNTDFKVKPWLRIGENMEFSYSEGGSIANHSNNNVITDLYERSPLIPVYDVAGNYSGPKGLPVGVLDLQPGGNNPVLGQVNGRETNHGFNSGIFGSAYLDIEPIKGLVAESKIGIQLYPYQYHYFQDTFPQNVYSGAYNSFSEGGGYSLDWRWTNKLSYDFTIHHIHKISAFIAYEARRFTSRFNGATTPNLPYTLLSYQYLTSGVPIDSIGLVNMVSGGGDVQTNQSVFGNINYSLLDRYLFSVVLRRDGSSKFGQFNRYGTFPSASVGWRLSEEKFMQKFSWINDLKIRGAYGTNGNDAIPSGLTVNQYSSDTYTSSYDLGGNNSSASTGFGLYQIGNPYLEWEVNKTTNIGFDATLFNRKFTASFNWFNRITDHLLYTPPFTGLEGDALVPYQNVLKFSNKGVELELGYTSAKHVVSYDMNFNIATYRNKVLYISNDTSAFIQGDGFGSTHVILNRSKVGLPVASFFGYVQEGIFQTTKDVQDHATETGIDKDNPETGLGHFKFKDINNDGVINEQDRTYIGSPHPKFTFGYNLNLYYKNFDLNLFIEGVSGNKIFNYWRAYTTWPGALGAGSNDTWSSTNTKASLPVWESSGANDAAASTFFIENGSYARIKSLQVGYTFPTSKTFSKLRIYAQAFNLATFTKYSGIDPEISTGDPGSVGDDLGGNYPIAVKVLFGINIGL
ncbi:MAG: TonB-dependent receptor [Parafilimonas sp.]